MSDGLYLIVPDLHFPYNCKRFGAITLDVLRFIRPSGFVQLGDFVDWWQLSTYDHDPLRKDDILSDLKLYSAYLEEVDRDLGHGSVIHQLEGNHEDRLRKYTWRNAKGLATIIPAIPTLLDFERRIADGRHEWHWHPHSKWNSLKIGNTVIHHGFYYDKAVAQNNLTRYCNRGLNFIQGHTHRVQYASNGDYWSASMGHGSSASATAHSPTPNDWAQAIGILSVHKGIGTLEMATTVNDELRLWGRIFKG